MGGIVSKYLRKGPLSSSRESVNAPRKKTTSSTSSASGSSSESFRTATDGDTSSQSSIDESSVSGTGANNPGLANGTMLQRDMSAVSTSCLIKEYSVTLSDPLEHMKEALPRSQNCFAVNINVHEDKSVKIDGSVGIINTGDNNSGNMVVTTGADDTQEQKVRVTSGQSSNPIFDNIIALTWKRIDHHDESKHVSTHAERSAYMTVLKSGRLFITGKSGSGKSRLGLNILGRIAKETGRVPVELSSWKRWEVIPQNVGNQYVVMIDDIFGSSNLDQTHVNNWLKMFDRMLPDVECGNVLLVLTSRPEICSLCQYQVKKKDMMRNMNYIDLDEGTYALTLDEKWRMLGKICNNYFSPQEKFHIVNMDTSLGFPQCCHFFSRSKDAKKMHVSFFINPYCYILDEVNSLRECDGIAYLVLLILLMKGGSLQADNFNYRTTDDFKAFVEKLRDCCRLTETPTLGYIRDKADSLCGVYLTETDEEYEFQHQSISDAVFLSISRRDPDICIDICPLRILMEFVRTKSVDQNENKVILRKKHYGALVRRITDFLLSEEYDCILDHPCFCDKDFLEFMVKQWVGQCRLTDIVMRKHKEMQVSISIPVQSRTLTDIEHPPCLFSYTIVLAGIILKNLPDFVRLILAKMSDKDSLASSTDLLPCAIFAEDNNLIQILLDLGTKPKEDCFRALCESVHIDETLKERICLAVEVNLDGLKDLDLLFGSAVMKGNTTLVKMITSRLGDTELCQNMSGKYLEMFIAHLASHHKKVRIFDRSTVSDMSKILFVRSSVDTDHLVWLAASHPDASALKVFLSVQVVTLDKEFEHQYKPDAVSEHATTVTYPLQRTRALHQASAYGGTDCVSSLIEYCMKNGKCLSSFVNVAADLVSGYTEGFYPLHLAAMYGKIDSMDILIASGADINIKSSSGQTPLHLALLHSKLDAVKLLLQKQSDTTLTDSNGHTALSCLYGDPYNRRTTQLRRMDIVRLFVDSGCDITVVDRRGRSILHRAVTFQDRETVEFLCDVGFDVNQRDSSACTVLQTAAECPDVGIVEYLCEKGADTEALDGVGRTVLHIAALSNCAPVEKLTYFLDVRKIDVNLVDTDGRTVLYDAVEYGLPEVVDLLIAKGADVNHSDEEGKTALFQIHRDCGEIVDLLLQQGVDLTHNDMGGRTALFNAAESSNLEVLNRFVEIGLKKGLNLKERDYHDRSLLHAACSREISTRAIKTVLDIGVDPNEQDREGNTPLHILCQCYNFRSSETEVRKILDLFICKKANLNLQNRKGKTPLDIAIENEMQITASALTSMGAQKAHDSSHP